MLKKSLLITVIFIFTGIISDAGLSTLETIPVSLRATLPPLAAENYAKSVKVASTAYGPPLFPEGQLTFLGDGVSWGDIAVDPNGEIPLGSRVRIFDLSGHVLFDGAIFRAVDTGRLIEGGLRDIDIWMPTLEMQQEWGIQEVEVKIIDGLENVR